nr:MAG TPA: hypothetical protein [Caudoviricetes sp.]
MIIVLYCLSDANITHNYKISNYTARKFKLYMIVVLYLFNTNHVGISY